MFDEVRNPSKISSEFQNWIPDRYRIFRTASQFRTATSEKELSRLTPGARGVLSLGLDATYAWGVANCCLKLLSLSPHSNCQQRINLFKNNLPILVRCNLNRSAQPNLLYQ